MFHNGIEEATTIWELWNSHNGSAGMDSRNHHMFSSVSHWIRTDGIGFSQAGHSYGYEELELHPARWLVPSEAIHYQFLLSSSYAFLMEESGWVTMW